MNSETLFFPARAHQNENQEHQCINRVRDETKAMQPEERPDVRSLRIGLSVEIQRVPFEDSQDEADGREEEI